MTPEQKARQQIDAMLMASGWAAHDYRSYNPDVAQGLALRQVPLKSGACAYQLIIDRKVVEVKKEGVTLSTVVDQSGRYGLKLPDFLATGGPLLFCYEPAEVETFFRDERDSGAAVASVFSFHRLATLAGRAAEANALRAWLTQMPEATSGMRQCQVEAITKLEESFAEDRQGALIQMGTGVGKTFTVCAKRIVTEVERRLSVAEELEGMAVSNLQRAGRFRQAILGKAFN